MLWANASKQARMALVKDPTSTLANELRAAMEAAKAVSAAEYWQTFWLSDWGKLIVESAKLSCQAVDGKIGKEVSKRLEKVQNEMMRYKRKQTRS